jgi:hypothetical protein
MRFADAFNEDRTVVEAQQARLTELGEAALVDITTDAARLHMRRTVDSPAGGGGAGVGRPIKRSAKCRTVSDTNTAVWA